MMETAAPGGAGSGSGGGSGSLESFAAAAAAAAAASSTALTHKNPFAIQELLGLSDHHQQQPQQQQQQHSHHSSNADAKDFKFSVAASAAAAALAQSSAVFSGGSGGGLGSGASGSGGGGGGKGSIFSDSYSNNAAAAAAAAAANSQRMYGVNAFSPTSFSGIPHFFHVDPSKQDPYGKHSQYLRQVHVGHVRLPGPPHERCSSSRQTQSHRWRRLLLLSKFLPKAKSLRTVLRQVFALWLLTTDQPCKRMSTLSTK